MNNQTIHEDQLPATMTDAEYSAWFAESHVEDGVRVGPARMPSAILDVIEPTPPIPEGDARLYLACQEIRAAWVEIARLRQWKQDACNVMTKWEKVWEALGRPGKLGRSKADGALVEVERLRHHELLHPCEGADCHCDDVARTLEVKN